MATGWPPVVLGINRPEVEKALQTSLKEAKSAGAPGNASITVLDAPDQSIAVHITGVSDAEAKSLWVQHLEPKLRKRLPVISIKGA